MNDGKVQLSFTLPIEWSEAADEAARQLVGKMGFADVQVVEGRRSRRGFSFFVVYASTPQSIDVRRIKAPSARSHAMSMDEIDAFVRERIGRKVRVAGACIGTDAHTVGIDAILNMKGYKGDYGLERYHLFETFNLGSQVSPSKIWCALPRSTRSTRSWPRKSSRRRAATSRTLPSSSSCSKPKVCATASC